MDNTPDKREGQFIGYFGSYSIILSFLLGKAPLKFTLLMCAILLGSALEVVTLSSLVPLLMSLAGEDDATLAVIEWINMFTGMNLAGSAGTRLLAYIFSVLIILSAIFRIWLFWFQAHFVTIRKHALATFLFEDFIRSPWKVFSRYHSSDVVNLIIREVDNFINYAVNATVTLIRDSLLLLSILLFMVLYSPLKTLSLCLIMFPYVIAINILSIVRARRWSHARRVVEEDRMKVVQEALNLFREIKIFEKDQFYLEMFKVKGGRLGRIEILQSVFRGFTRPALEIYVVIILLLYLSFSYASGEIGSSNVQFLVLIGIALLRVLPLYNSVAQSIHSIRYIAPTISNFGARLARRASGPEKESFPEVTFEKAIECEAVSFTHVENDMIILKEVSMTLRRGEVVAFIGETGSGKSTMVDLIIGLHAPESGCIKIDGVELRPENTHWWSKIGYVGQQNILIDDTVRNNIALGVPKEEQDETLIKRVAEISQISFVSTDIDAILSKKAGDGGRNLSGGERQRVCLARALYRRPKLLVMDEPTSALDAETEKLVMDQLLTARGDSTIIIISHSVKVAEYADRVFIFSNGEVTEETGA